METRNRNLMALAMAALITLALSQVGIAATHPLIRMYFPLNHGDRWSFVLEAESQQGKTHPTQDYPNPIEDVTASKLDESGRDIFVLSNYTFQLGSGDTQFFASRTNPEVMELSFDRTGVWYRFEEGQAISIPEFANDCIHGSKGTVLRRTNIAVPVGYLRNCLEISYTQTPCLKAGLVKEVFAPEIGLVQRTIANSDGSVEIWSLRRAEVNGRVYPRTGGDSDPDPTDRGVATSPTLQSSSWGSIKAVFEN